MRINDKCTRGIVRSTVFTLEELFAHLRSCEEKLRQTKEYKPKSKVTALHAQPQKPSESGFQSHSSSRSPNYHTLQNPESSNKTEFLSKFLQGALEFEKLYNKRHLEKNKRTICIVYNKEGHSIESYYTIFPNMKGGGRLLRHPHQQGENAMQAESTPQPGEGSGEEEGNVWSEIEETSNLALMAINDDKTSFDKNPQVPLQLDLNMIGCNSKIDNMRESASESIIEFSLNENTPNLRSLIDEMHNSLLRENKKIHFMHSNLLSLETQMKQLKCIGLELDNRSMRVSESEILDNIIHHMESQTQNHDSHDM